MNAIEGLRQIRRRLEVQGARVATLQAVDEVLAAAERQPGGHNASARSLGQLVKMLMRTQAAHANTQVYDDLTRLEADLAEATARIQAEREAEESRPVPKSTKYYKELKKKQRAAADKQL
jgi:cytochrome c peroxidase